MVPTDCTPLQRSETGANSGTSTCHIAFKLYRSPLKLQLFALLLAALPAFASPLPSASDRGSGGRL
jgi:hypothetical protein